MWFGKRSCEDARNLGFFTYAKPFLSVLPATDVRASTYIASREEGQGRLYHFATWSWEDKAAYHYYVMFALSEVEITFT